MTERRPRVRFDVNDAALREAFLRTGFLEALGPLQAETSALCVHHLLQFGLLEVDEAGAGA